MLSFSFYVPCFFSFLLFLFRFHFSSSLLILHPLIFRAVHHIYTYIGLYTQSSFIAVSTPPLSPFISSSSSTSSFYRYLGFRPCLRYEPSLWNAISLVLKPTPCGIVPGCARETLALISMLTLVRSTWPETDGGCRFNAHHSEPRQREYQHREISSLGYRIFFV